MKKVNTLTSLLVLGTVGLLVTLWITPETINLDFAEEDIHLYL